MLNAISYRYSIAEGQVNEELSKSACGDIVERIEEKLLTGDERVQYQ